MTRELAEDLAAAGHDVTVLTGWPNYPQGKLFPGWRRRFRSLQQEGGYRVLRVWHTLPRRSSFVSRVLWFAAFAMSSFLNILISRKFDVVYSHTTPLAGPVMTWLACRLKGMTFLYGIYDLYPEAAAEVGVVRRGLAYRFFRGLDTWVCRRAHSIPTLGPGIQEALVARGIPREKIPIIPFWIDAAKVRPLDRDNPWRREHGIALDKFIVLYAGTMGHVSGAAMMAEVAAKLRDVPNLLFLFVGEGVAKDQTLRRCEELGLTNTLFLPFQPQERLGEVLSSADIGVVTLRPGASRNSLPSKVLGYLAAGRAVVASVDDNSDTAECIRQGNCGRVAPAQDAEAMAETIQKMMAPGLATRYGLAAREYFLRHYSRQAAVGDFMKLMERL
jgi:colanic acid biosynthesis glycosyl transferase WcaI